MTSWAQWISLTHLYSFDKLRVDTKDNGMSGGQKSRSSSGECFPIQSGSNLGIPENVVEGMRGLHPSYLRKTISPEEKLCWTVRGAKGDKKNGCAASRVVHLDHMLIQSLSTLMIALLILLT